ncbi:transglutaminaseTgpA domain-containing protein [Deinococcus taeanensis]|uniref:transglutaminaseTgpA domain-containing protein n=1 Tax=Deinococcus taeanensis TaxID=2737050 RepID=UPI001CDC947A|nr:transglutaminaseTgpA domain-containing protein [Deinococcus taeanensis]UBV43517.1 transglutaminaseTgpA domain-containing protein [Deinococcus taeanensis]
MSWRTSRSPDAPPDRAAGLWPTGFGVAFLLLILLTLVGCVNYGLSLGYGLTFLLGGMWVLSAAQALRAARNVSVTVQAPPPVLAGADAPFSVAAAPGADGVLQVRLRGPGRAAQRSAPLRAGAPLTLTVPLPAPVRGPVTVKVTLHALDRLGLWRVTLPAPAPLTTLAHPVPESAPPSVPDRAAPDTGNGAARTRGDEDFAGLRPFTPGDSPRQVSWRHVARTGQLLTRETDAARGEAILLDWRDTHGDDETRLARLSAWVHALHAAGRPYALHLPGESVPAGRGEPHRLAVHNALALHAPLPVPPPAPSRSALSAALDRQALLWTLLALTLTLLPWVTRMPVWNTALVAALLGHTLLRGQPIRPGRVAVQPLPTWLLALLAVAGGAALNATYGTLLGRDAGTAFLTLLVALKTAETRTRRDGQLLVTLGLFLTSTQYFFSQGPLSAAFTVLAAAALLAAASTWVSPAPPLTWPRVGGRLGRVVRLMALATPLAAALFVLFPRPQQPLWQLPVQGQALTGLGSEVRAGSFTNLAQSDAVAFRADFQDAVPGPTDRYWRGPVLEAYDGEAWKQVRGSAAAPSIEATGAPITYALTLEPSGTPWLLALDAPVRVPDGAFISGAFQAVTLRFVTSRRRVELVSQPALLGRREDQNRLAFNQQLPHGQSPRALTLGQSWQALAPEARVQAALTFLRKGNYRYTLAPALLPEQDRVDAFLFGTREGFCEHYASAFAFLMRASGLSARVVTGYLGGEVNPDGGYLIIRQRDAHAWTEVWLPDRGWVRVDPTAEIAPARRNADVRTALSSPVAAAPRAPGTLERLRLRLDALQNRWNDLVVDYDGQAQAALLERAGLRGLGPGGLLWLLFPVTLATLLPAWFTLRRRARPADPASRALQDLTGRLRVPRAPGETPTAYVSRVTQTRPDLTAPLQAVLAAYHAARYAPGDPAPALRALKAAVRALPRR